MAALYPGDFQSYRHEWEHEAASRPRVDAALEYALDLVVRARPSDPLSFVASKLRVFDAGDTSEPTNLVPLSKEEAALSVHSYLRATITPALAEALGALGGLEDPGPERPIEWVAAYLDEWTPNGI